MTSQSLKNEAFSFFPKDHWLKITGFLCPKCSSTLCSSSEGKRPKVFYCDKCTWIGNWEEVYSIHQPIRDKLASWAAIDYLVLKYVEKNWSPSLQQVFMEELSIILQESTNSLINKKERIRIPLLVYKPGDYLKAAKKTKEKKS